MQSANLVQQRHEKACFGVGTPLLTPDGSRPIEQLHEGDLVLSRSETDPDGQVEAKRIEEMFVRTGRIWVVKVQGSQIRTTAEQSVFVVRRWKFAPVCELQPGDLLFSSCGRLIRIEEVRDTGRFETVCNLCVAEFHTYFVGCLEWGWNVWAHNEYWAEQNENLRLRREVAEQLKAVGMGPFEANALAILGGLPGTNGGALRAAASAAASGQAPVYAQLRDMTLQGWQPGETLGTRIQGTNLTVEEVYAHMAALGHTGSPDPITFHCAGGGCQARAQIMIEQMQRLGVPPEQIQRAWAMSEAIGLPQPLDGYPGRSLHPSSADGTPLAGADGPVAGWSFHVGPAVPVQTPHGAQMRVIDPSTFREPAAVADWHGRVGTGQGPHSQQLTPLGQAPIDPFTGFSFAGSGYRPHRGGDPAIGASADARRIMADRLSTFPLPPL